ncbi:MAG: AraC family transcriptional regulator [Hyphomicrobiaceae bacterium]|nr:AraC family transcriptional regulator [Hyphomicrobiaceae bacterium]
MPSHQAASERPRIEARILGEGRGWKVSSFVCRAGPQDRKFEERHDWVAIAAVVSGTFVYNGATGRHLLHPGALLLGNHGSCFECGHDHSHGDHCIGFQFTTEVFAEVAALAGGGTRFTFPTAMVPAGGRTAAAVASAIAGAEAPQRAEEWALHLAETVVVHTAGVPATAVSVAPRDERRISAALRRLEVDYADPIDVEALAETARMTKYHFIRTFRRVVGVTPYQFLLETRLRQVARRLAQSAVPVSEAALEAGFGDLSTFNARFRGRFGMAPTAYRALHARTLPGGPRRRSLTR